LEKGNRQRERAREGKGTEREEKKGERNCERAKRWEWKLAMIIN